MTPDARRRMAGTLMAEQFNRPTPQDTEVVERASLLPFGTYANGMTGPAIPGFIYDGFMAPGDILSGKKGDYQDNREEWAKAGFDAAGSAMVGGLAGPRPRGSVGMGGRAESTGAALNAAGESGEIRGYRGSSYGSSVAPSFNRSPIYWGSSSPELAADYAAHSFGPAGPSVTPASFNFKNPLEIDAAGAGWQAIPYGGKAMTTDKIAMDAQKAGHDGVVFRNIVDNVKENMTSADTIAALQPGTVYSPLTGELLYANGGRPGAAVGAATNALAERHGIRAYHGSPHDFDRFDMSKIGTGEGAQAYGHGLYFAENEGVAKYYREALSKAPNANFAALQRNPGQYRFAALPDDGVPKTFDDHMAREIINGGVPFVDYHIALTKAMIERERVTAESVANAAPRFEPQSIIDKAKRTVAEAEAHLAELEALKKGGTDLNKGRLYEVRINASPDDFLDWDKPLSQQSEKVRGALGQFNPQADLAGLYSVRAVESPGKPTRYSVDTPDGPMAGFRSREEAQAYADTQKAQALPIRDDETLGNYLQRMNKGPAVTDALKGMGIPGVRYLDQGSRTAGEGSRNYVVFDDNLVDIIRKYGLLGMIGGGAAMQGMQSAPEDRNKALAKALMEPGTI